jgi:DNA-binding MarR family transcriptional regulator
MIASVSRRTPTPPPEPDPPDSSAAETRAALVDALLTATRAMVGLAARSLADLDADVTLPQYRTMIVLASRGPQRITDIATELGVNPSTGTRMCDRLVRKGLVRRYRSTADRRAVRLTLTPPGRALVEQVTRRRRDDLVALVEAVPESAHGAVTDALHALATKYGELPESQWWLGWQSAADGRSDD